VTGTLAFADHHRYAGADVRKIAAAAQASGVRVVMTTEKDLVRLEACAPLPFEVVAVPMRLELQDWSGLAAALDQMFSERRRVA
jgi:tetraacyldisaccharide 4'-kinase